MTLDFADADGAAATVARWSATRPLAAVVGVDDATTTAAAAIAERLGLKSNALAAVTAARDKFQMRQCLAAAGVPVPRFRRIAIADDPLLASRRVAFPCVLKPLALSASRGVIRVNNADQFMAAFRRIAHIVKADDVQLTGDAAQFLIAEAFVDGLEVALEGLLVRDTLHTLALFDKPDPLNGPYFEETIYVTPSRLPAAVQERVREVTARACAALGLTEGPVHAAVRINERGVWPIELAGRSIGGLCSSVLEFGTGVSLEELILRHAVGLDLPETGRSGEATGVMM